MHVQTAVKAGVLTGIGLVILLHPRWHQHFSPLFLGFYAGTIGIVGP